MLESGAMFEVRLQTYWGDADAAGIVFFPNYFKFVAQAEEELYRAAGLLHERLMVRNGIWLPRAEVFAKSSFPIRNGAAIRVRLTPNYPGDQAVRYEFEIVDDKDAKSMSEGFVTAICVNRSSFEPMAFPPAIRDAIAAM